MAANITGSRIKDTYSQLLHVDGGLSASETVVTSGVGAASSFSLGTDSASLGNIQFVAATDTITNLTTGGSITITGNGAGVVNLPNVNITGGDIAGITPLALSYGGTGASTAAGARTNLGLGTIATQAASAVSITGGTMSAMTSIAGTAVAAGNLSMSANTLVSTDTNGSITITPDGSGTIKFLKAFGYAIGIGNVVTQSTSKSTAVVLDAPCGTITMNNAALNAGVSVSFTFTNSYIAAADCVIFSIASGGSASSYFVQTGSVGSGTCTVHVRNVTAGNLSEALVLNFALIKSATS